VTAIHHPAPVNQFYRLDYDEVAKRFVKTSRWNHRHPNAKGVMTEWDGVLCMAGEGAVCLDAHTLGADHSTPGGIHDAQDDNMGGIGVTDVDVAWHRRFGQDLLTPDGYDRNDVLNAIRAQRRHVILGVDYGAVPYAERVQKDGDFDHAIGLEDWRSSDGHLLRYDTLDANPKWVPGSTYWAAAEALALRVRGTKSRLFVGLSRIRPLIVPDTVTIVVHPEKGTKGYPALRYFGVYTVVNGVVQPPVQVARTGGFTATGDSRAFYPYPGHSRQELVRITGPKTNRFVGKYVRAAYVKD
jgi:hypothetical protein